MKVKIHTPYRLANLIYEHAQALKRAMYRASEAEEDRDHALLATRLRVVRAHRNALAALAARGITETA